MHYRRAPENPYPAPTQDAYEALLWAADEADMLKVDTDRMAVAGDSAGGNLAAACALLARDRQGPRLRMQALVYPTLDADLNTHSYLHNTQDAFLTREAMSFALNAFLPDGLDGADGYALPMLATDHAGLPPAYLLLADHDPLLDDGLRYADKLRQAGTAAQVRVGQGMIHASCARAAIAPWPKPNSSACAMRCAGPWSCPHPHSAGELQLTGRQRFV